MGHDERVARVARDVRARVAKRGGVVSLGRGALSHFVPSPFDPRHTDAKLDVRDLVEILDVDVARRTCTAEPGVTFSDLVRATLPHGLAPTLCPELEGITLGGAVAGGAVESMSHRHGGFHDSGLEYEVVTGTGEVLRCSREENADVFEMMHGSYGTLGVITKLTFRLVPARPFVRVEYRPHTTFDAFEADLSLHTGAPDVDFVDAIVHARDRFVLCVGRFVDSAPWTSSYTGTEIYYRSTLERREDFLTTYDYFFRYDTDCHWSSRVIPGMHTRVGRRLLGRHVLGSTNMLAWARRFRPLARLSRRAPPVVTDLFIPRRRFAEMYAWYEREIGHYPLWLVPYRMPAPYPWIHPAHLTRAGDDHFIDVAIYGLPNDRPGVDSSRLLEEKTDELGGIKTLIGENHYDEATFSRIYDRDAYARVKRRTDPHGLFRDVYEKLHYDRRGRGAPTIAEARREPSSALHPLHDAAQG